MLRDLVALMRPKHYVKNGLILAPLVFGGQLLNLDKLATVIVAIVIFSLLSSVVYIFNDIQDVEKDRHHPAKKNRPLASGAVTVQQARWLCVVLLVVSAALFVAAGLDTLSLVLLLAYLVLNIGYSLGLKNYPIVDIAILASGFVIRILYGASVVDIEVSHWLYLTVLAGAFYASLGKRRNEIMTTGAKSRKVNEAYSLQFLDKNMYVCLTLALVFYSLWATEPSRLGSLFYTTIPLVMLLFLAYGLAIEKNESTGDPIDLIFSNKFLAVLVPLLFVVIAVLVYI